MGTDEGRVTGRHARLRLLFAALAAASLLAIGLLLVRPEPGEAATVNISSGSNWYCDEGFEGGVCETSVNAGDTVIWEMVQGSHTVTECDDTFSDCPPAGGGFNSGILSSGQTFAQTFASPDIVEYLCTLHDQQMRGRIIVNASTASPTATPSPSPSPSPSPTPAPSPGFVLTQLANTGKNQATGLAMIPGTTDQAVMINQLGALWKVDLSNPAATPAPFGNVADRLTKRGDEGLLGVAFEGNDPSQVYINYTRGTEYYVPYSDDTTRFPVTPTVPPDPKRSRIARFQVTGGVMDMNTEETIYESLRPGDWHTLNQIVFDDEGYLYAGSGDGGWIEANFDADHGQGVGNELATIIRINPNNGAPGHSVPLDNPFHDGAGPNKDEVYAYGLRNPWRISFDRLTGELWAADVGQWYWEEVNKVVPGGNYGWAIMEGAFCRTSGCSPPLNHSPPRTAYCNRFNSSSPCEFLDECAVMGGYVYRGSLVPQLYGDYVYGDFCSGRFRAVQATGSSPAELIMDTAIQPVSFAETPAGELLVVAYDGSIHQLDWDGDGDGRGALADNCPAWYNPTQSLPAWTVPPGDSDCDGFTDSTETYLTTNGSGQCAATSNANDEASPDAWPFDMNDDQRANTVDVGFYVGKLGLDNTEPGWTPRLDLNRSPNGIITTVDVAIYVGRLGNVCSPAGP